MKTITKSVIALSAAAIMIFSSCNRGSGCGTWGQSQYKKQYHSQQDKKDNYTNYKKYNS